MKLLKPIAISFEFFPPKTKEGVEQLMQTANALVNYAPRFFSVTFGAGGSTRDGTCEMVKMLSQNTKAHVAPHLACIGSLRKDIAEIIATYKKEGVKRIVALRGDLPSGTATMGEMKYASELVSLIRAETGDYFHIEVAAYPEIHPQAISAQDDVQNLKRKYLAGANSAITQYFFNADAYFYYLDECEKEGIDMPVIPGIMPITQFARLARFSDACGAEIPRWIRTRLASYGDDIDSIKAFGLDVVYKLCEKLLAGGAPGLHFYTLNKAQATLQLLSLLIEEKAPAKTKVDSLIASK